MKAGRGKDPVKLHSAIAIIPLLLLAILTSCSRDAAEAKSMEQIYAEQGIPVEVQVVNTVPYNVRHIFNKILVTFTL